MKETEKKAIGKVFEKDAVMIANLKAHCEEIASRHSCGLQGFDPAWDVCQVCERHNLLEEGLSEEDAAKIAKLKALSSGRPNEMGSIERGFREELEEALEEIKNRT